MTATAAMNASVSILDSRHMVRLYVDGPAAGDRTKPRLPVLPQKTSKISSLDDYKLL